MVVLAGAAGAGYFYLPEIAAWAVPRIASDHGVAVCEFEIRRPTFSSARIRNAKFTAGDVTVIVRGATVGYSAEALWEQRLKTLVADRVEVRIKVDEGKATGEVVIPDPFELVPVDQLVIEELYVSMSPSMLSGELMFDSNAASFLGVLFHERDTARVSLQFSRDHEFNVSAWQFSRGDGQIGLTGSIEGDTIQVEEGRFEVSYPLVEVEGYVNASGSFDGGFNINRPMETLKVSLESEVELAAEQPRQVRMEGRFDASVDGESLNLSDGRFNLASNPIAVADQDIRLDEVRVYIESLEFKSPELSAVGQARTHLMAPPVNFRVEADPFSQRGEFELTFENPVSQPLLKDMMPGWRSDYDLVQGEVNAVASGRFAATESGFDVDAGGTISIREGAGLYGKTTFAGLDVTAPFTFRKEHLEIESTAFGIEMVDVGLPVRRLGGSVAGSLDQLVVTNFRAEVLGGAVSVDELAVSLDPLSTRFEVNLASISIAEVLALEGDDISGHGTLDGVLPISFSDGAVLVEKGTLKARAPGGHLAYLGTMPATNPGLDLAIRALRDFDYEVLEAGADMAEDGELRLLVKLHGSSPNVENGRPIHFNLNVTENIPVLLESLRASRAMTDRVQERLRR